MALLVICSLFICTLFLIDKELLKGIRMPTWLITLSSIYFSWVIFNISFNHAGLMTETMINRSVFIVLTLGFLASFNLSKYFLSKWFLGSLALSFFIVQIVINLFLLDQGFTHLNTSDYIPLFGNKNYYAEYLGFSYLLLIPLYLETKNVIFKNILLLLLLSAIFNLYLVFSRSTLLAVTLILLFFILLAKQYRQQMIKIFMLSLLTCLFVSVFFSPTKLDSLHLSGIDDSSRMRKSAWSAAANLIMKNPLGIGYNQFEFSYIQENLGKQPHNQERHLPKHPHNEFLNIMLEDGYLGFIVIIIFIRLLYSAIKFGIKKRDDNVLLTTLGTSLFLLFQIAFHFPFNHPVGIFFCAIAFALLVKIQISSALSFSLNIYLRPFVLIILTLLLIVGGGYLFSYQKFSNPNINETEAHLACKFFPSNWRACISEARLKLESGDPRAALPLLEKQLVINKFNFIALRYLATTLMMTEQTEQACRVYLIYDSIFSNASSLHSTRLTLCPTDIDVSGREHILMKYQTGGLDYIKRGSHL